MTRPPALLRVCVLLGVALLAPAARAQASAPGGVHAIRAAALIDSTGQIVSDGLVVFAGEAIAQVGGEAPAGVAVDEYAGAVLCAGLVDCQAALGVWGGMTEQQSSIQPQIRTADAFNRFTVQLRRALAAGVTTFALAPDDQNLIGGRIAVCQTAGPKGTPRVLSAAGPLKLSLAQDAWKLDREPTSRSGALGLLRETLEAARGDTRTDATLAAFATGRLPALLTAPSGADVLAAVELSAEYGVRLVLIHTLDARRVAELAAGKLAGVIVGPLSLTASEREAVAAGYFERQGVPVALAGGLPGTPPDTLRIGAAVATRAGLTPAAARRAITAVPAELLGVADRVGVLQAGHQADVVVFSGDPLDLRTRVLAVYVGGHRVYVARASAAQGEER